MYRREDAAVARYRVDSLGEARAPLGRLIQASTRGDSARVQTHVTGRTYDTCASSVKFRIVEVTQTGAILEPGSVMTQRGDCFCFEFSPVCCPRSSRSVNRRQA
jgi:hypothetical protein